MGPKLTERIKNLRKTAILEAAKVVFARYGIDAARVEDIAAHAGVSKGLVYFYYKGKEDLLFNLLKEELDKLHNFIDEIRRTDLEFTAKLQRLVSGVLEYFEENREFFCIFTPGRGGFTRERRPQLIKRILPRYMKTFDLLSELLQEGIDHGVLRPIDPMFMAHILQGMLHALVVQWLLVKDLSLKKYAPLVVDVFMEGTKRR